MTHAIADVQLRSYGWSEARRAPTKPAVTARPAAKKKHAVKPAERAGERQAPAVDMESLDSVIDEALAEVTRTGTTGQEADRVVEKKLRASKRGKALAEIQDRLCRKYLLAEPVFKARAALAEERRDQPCWCNLCPCTCKVPTIADLAERAGISVKKAKQLVAIEAEVMPPLFRTIERIVYKVAAWGKVMNGLPDSDYEDLVSEGRLALLEKGIPKFDPDRGFRLVTYAMHWVRHYVGRCVVDKHRTIRVPVHVMDTSRHITRVRHELSRSLHRPPTTSEIAVALCMSVAQVELVLHGVSMLNVRSLDAVVFSEDDGDGSLLHDHLADESPLAEDVVGDRAAMKRLLHHIEALDARERHVLRRRFLTDTEDTLQQLGTSMGLSRERIRQLEVRALEKLRKQIDIKDGGAAAFGR